jgi:1,2-diacylglycerol 3-beta-galactosyltransferase
LITNTFWPYIRRGARRLVNRNPAEVIVSFHPMANAPVLRALGSTHPPFITVVTDLVSTHALWYHRRADLVLVPTAEAEKRAVQFGLHKERVRVVGLPVAQEFCIPAAGKEEIRRRKGWPLDLPLVLLIGGGDGMGPLKETAWAISRLKQKLALVIVAGRNQRLKKQLESISWPMPVFVHGFVRDMPDFMNAADILVTKAGPGTISEAFNAGLPMVLYSRLPGQEEGNVGYVLSKGAGVWAPSPDLIASALSNWLQNPEKCEKASAASQSLASPKAARTVADILAEQVGVRLEA